MDEKALQNLSCNESRLCQAAVGDCKRNTISRSKAWLRLFHRMKVSYETGGLSLEAKNTSFKVQMSHANKTAKETGKGGSAYVEARHCATLRATLELLHWTENMWSKAGASTAVPRSCFSSKLDVVPNAIIAFLFQKHALASQCGKRVPLSFFDTRRHFAMTLKKHEFGNTGRFSCILEYSVLQGVCPLTGSQGRGLRNHSRVLNAQEGQRNQK